MPQDNLGRGIDLQGRKMWYAPWPVTQTGVYRSPAADEREEIFGISGEAVRETLLYFEEQCGRQLPSTSDDSSVIPGCTRKLLDLLNSHVVDPKFAITRDDLLDASRWYGNEYYFYFIIFVKNIAGRFDFRFGESVEKTLSAWHRPYEVGFLDYTPMGKDENDRKIEEQGGNYVIGGLLYVLSVLPSERHELFKSELIDFVNILGQPYSMKLSEEILWKEFQWYSFDLFMVLFSLFQVYANNNRVCFYAAEIFLKKYDNPTIRMIIKIASLMPIRYFFENVVNSTTNTSKIAVRHYEQGQIVFDSSFHDAFIRKYGNYLYQRFALDQYYLAQISGYPTTFQMLLGLKKPVRCEILERQTDIRTGKFVTRLTWEKPVSSGIFIALFLAFVVAVNLVFFFIPRTPVVMIILSNVAFNVLFILRLQFSNLKNQETLIRNLEELQHIRKKEEIYTLQILQEKQTLEQKVQSRTAELASANEQLVSRQKEIDADFGQASLVQKTILTPKSYYETLPGIEIDVVYLPMNGTISGDYYNLAPIRNGIASILIADAAGHGIQAALSTMQLDILNREHLGAASPDVWLESLNSDLVNRHSSKNFFTAFTCHVWHDRIRYASAAHPVQYLLRPSQGEIIPLKGKGKVIGMLEDLTFEPREEPLQKGDILLLFTDGIFEEFDHEGNEWGEDGLRAFIRDHMNMLLDRPVREWNALLLDRMKGIIGNRPVNDDITLITARLA